MLAYVVLAGVWLLLRGALALYRTVVPTSLGLPARTDAMGVNVAGPWQIGPAQVELSAGGVLKLGGVGLRVGRSLTH